MHPVRSRWPAAAAVLVVAMLFALGLPGAAFAAAPTTKPPPTPTVTFGLGPATGSKVDGRPYFNFLASPLSRFSDRVAVVNVSAKPLTLRLYVTDATNGPDGSFTYPLPTAPVRDAGRWLSVGAPADRQAIVVPPRSTRTFPVTVAVPADASPGDHAAAVIVSLTARSTNGSGQRVTLDQRVATRAFFRISGGLAPRLTVDGLTTTYDGRGLLRGEARVRYRVHNTGNVKLAGMQRVDVGGLLSHRVLQGADLPVLLPGATVDVTAVVKDVLPQIRMSTKVSLTPLAVQGDALPPVQGVHLSERFWAVPWLVLLAILLALLVLVSLVITIARRRRRAPRPPTAALHPVDQVVRAPVEETRSWTRVTAAVLGLVLGLGVAVLPGRSALAGEAVPYTDPAVTGSIGLCDVNGHNVLTGKTTDKPFVWLAVGSTAAPAPYASAGRTAFLAGYQPRQGVEPGDWSGYGLAAASRYTNPSHPMSQSTPISATLGDFLSRYPPKWNGLIQLRLLLGGSARPPRTDAYDATDIQVTGHTWRVVRGGTGPCKAGKATSSAVLLNLPGAKGTPKPSPVDSTAAHQLTPPPASAAPSQVVATPAGATVGATGGATGNPAASSARNSAPAGSGSSTALIVGGTVLAVLAAAGLLTWAVRRRGSS